MAQNSTLVHMMASGEFSDLVFSCNGEYFNVHKAVVCRHSLIIRAAVQGGVEEPQTSVIQMDEFDSSTVQRFIQFMYTGDYAGVKDEADQGSGNDPKVKTEGDANPSPGPPESAGATSMASLLDHIRVNNIADYYRVDPLVSLTINKIRNILESGGEDKFWIQGLPAAADAALDSADDNELLDVLASAISNNISKILELDILKNINGITDFSIKVLTNCTHKFQTSEERSARSLSLARRQAHAAEKARQYADDQRKVAEASLQETERQLKAALASLQAERRQRQEQATETERRVNEARQSMEPLVRQTEAQNARLENCIQILNNTENCRNIACRWEFPCYIDLNEGLLHCSHCRCRHYGSA